jgi:hypothetical protein
MREQAMEQDDGLTSEDIVRLGRKLFEVEGDYYPESSDEIERIYEALVKELRAALRDREQKIASLQGELERLRGVAEDVGQPPPGSRA